MKKFKLIAVILLIGCCMGACQQRTPMTVTFGDITTSGSTDTTFKVNYATETEFKNLYTDLLIRCETGETKLQIAKEYEEFITILIPDSSWHSLTALIKSAQGEYGKETYGLYKDTVSVTYIINSEENTKVSFKAVVGTVEKNSSGGQLLMNKKEISKQFDLEVLKKENK